MSLQNSPEPATKECPTRDRHTNHLAGQVLRSTSAYHDGGTRGLHANEPARLRRTYRYKNSGRSPIADVRPMAPAVWQNNTEKRTRDAGEEPPISRQRPPISRGTNKNVTESTHSIASTKSSTTLAKELNRHNEVLPTYVQDQVHVIKTPKQGTDVLKHDNVNNRWFSPEVCDISELSTHDQKHTAGTSPKGTIQESYTPYRSTKKKAMAKGIRSGARVRVRKPSVKSFSASRGISETLDRQKRDAAPKYSPSGRPIKDSNSTMTSTSYPGLSRKRRPSILSTKVRKHSNNSPIARDSSHGVVLRQSVKRGQVSPQTTSLYYSFRLLEGFDYVGRRLKEIQQIKQEYLDAIADLNREKVRLEALLAQLLACSRVTDQAVGQ